MKGWERLLPALRRSAQLFRTARRLMGMDRCHVCFNFERFCTCECDVLANWADGMDERVRREFEHFCGPRATLISYSDLLQTRAEYMIGRWNELRKRMYGDET